MADRQRRYRQRQRRRQAVYRVCSDDRVLTALLVSGRLSEDDALDRGQVEGALTDVLAEWAGHWCK